MNTLTNLLFDVIEKNNLSMIKSTIRGIDYIINNTPIIIKDWNRAIGVDVVIQADKTRKYNSQINHQIIILTNRYSDPAKSLADHISIQLLTLKEFEVAL